MRIIVYIKTAAVRTQAAVVGMAHDTPIGGRTDVLADVSFGGKPLQPISLSRC